MPRTLAPCLLIVALASVARADEVALTWVEPVERAREVAREQQRPLLILSVSGNREGFC